MVGSHKDWVDVNVGIDGTRGIRNGEYPYAWGSYIYNGVLGYALVPDNYRYNLYPNIVDGKSIVQGYEHSCILSTSGSLWCNGRNKYGQVGVTSFILTNGIRIYYGYISATWSQVSGVNNHTCAIHTTGTLYCWGYNSNYELGDGTQTHQSAPTQVGLETNWKSVSTSNNFTCAIQGENNTLKCFGITPNHQEWYGENDECIIWTIMPNVWEDGTENDNITVKGVTRTKSYLGTEDFNPNALALDQDGDLWVGSSRDNGFLELFVNTKSYADVKVKRFVPLSITPFGAVIDKNGILWTIQESNGAIVGINTNDNAITIGAITWSSSGAVHTPPSLDTYSSHGIAVDFQNRVWKSSKSSSADWHLAFYNTEDETWTKSTISNENTSYTNGGGVLIQGDKIWHSRSSSTSEKLIKYSVNSSGDIIEESSFLAPSGISGNATLGYDLNNHIWSAHTDGLSVFDDSTSTRIKKSSFISSSNNYNDFIFLGNNLSGALNKTFMGCTDNLFTLGKS